ILMSVQIRKSKNEIVTLKNGDEFNNVSEKTGNDKLDKIIEIAGYAYDPEQDIFYSIMDPWQRDIGYCRLYDELAAPTGMIIDCEPIYFEYNEKKWMIGFWKGQYDLVTGAEIGVYTKAFKLKILGFNCDYYDCVRDTDLLQMSYILKKNGKTLFTRKGKHWWLTGFKLGEFSNPSELTMDITITLHNLKMRNAFVKGLWNAGYPLNKFITKGNTVKFTFDCPRTPQPFTRIPVTDRIIQRKNQLLCEKYHEITGPSENVRDKVKAIQENAPEIYAKIISAGKSKQLYKLFSSWLLTQKR
ncbi:MAG: DUF4474 domain-containing protein, partial [Desulfosporosinus sp.]